MWPRKKDKKPVAKTRKDLEQEIGAPPPMPFITQHATYCRTIELIKPLETSATYREAFQSDEDMTKWASREVSVRMDENNQRYFDITEIKSEQTFIEAIFSLSAFERMADEELYQYQRTVQTAEDIAEQHYLKVAESEGLVFAANGRPHIINKNANLPATNGRFYEKDLDRAEAHRNAANAKGPNVNQPKFLTEVFAEVNYKGNFELSLQNAEKLADFYKLPELLKDLYHAGEEFTSYSIKISSMYSTENEVEKFNRALGHVRSALKALKKNKIIEDLQSANDFLDQYKAQSYMVLAQNLYEQMNTPSYSADASERDLQRSTSLIKTLRKDIIAICDAHNTFGKENAHKIDEMIANGTPQEPGIGLVRVIKRLRAFINDIKQINDVANRPPHISFAELFNPEQTQAEKAAEVISAQKEKERKENAREQAPQASTLFKRLLKTLEDR